jgi:hypothetical protein
VKLEEDVVFFSDESPVDLYDVTVPDPRLVFRVAAAMAVALGAPQSR